MLLGDTCTRRFCALKTGRNPAPPDPIKPDNTAKAIASRGVEYIVLTSVDRDDLPDGGSGHFARTVVAMKALKPEILIECLTSDFRGALEAVTTLAYFELDVLAHNIETIRSKLLSPETRKAVQRRNGLMLGLGESDEEVKETMADPRAISVGILTLGQYLQPAPLHLTVKESVTPEKFNFWNSYGEAIGFRYVASGPLVRSSITGQWSYLFCRW